LLAPNGIEVSFSCSGKSLRQYLLTTVSAPTGSQFSCYPVYTDIPDHIFSLLMRTVHRILTRIRIKTLSGDVGSIIIEQAKRVICAELQSDTHLKIYVAFKLFLQKRFKEATMNDILERS
jgi:hypothetical protein